MKWKRFWAEYRRITWSFKNRPHIYIFLTKIFMDLRRFFALWFLGFSPCFMCVLCRAKILPQIYTRIIASLKPPPYTRIICEKNFAPDIYENCEGVWNLCARLIERWYLFVCLYHVLYLYSSFEEGYFCWSIDVKIWL